jgi:hypothetical protein
MHRFARGLAVIVLLIAQHRPADAATQPSPPGQPASGPGGAETAFDWVVATEATATTPGYWRFEPAGPHAGVDASAPLPVVLFLGGCCMPDNTNAPAAVYRAWIDHLVRRGAVVLFPTYRLLNAGVDVANFVKRVSALPDAGEDAPLDWARLTIVAHSYGGVLAAGYAAVAASRGLPVPLALMLAMPGCIGCRIPTDLSTILPPARVVILVGSDDTLIGRSGADVIWQGLTKIPAEDRAYLTASSDHHGQPPLIASHDLPVTNAVDGVTGVLDALDWYGTWKLTDALIDCSFFDRECEVAFGSTPAQRFMGTWDDGVPVAELRVTQDAATPIPG